MVYKISNKSARLADTSYLINHSEIIYGVGKVAETRMDSSYSNNCPLDSHLVSSILGNASQRNYVIKVEGKICVLNTLSRERERERDNYVVY